MKKNGILNVQLSSLIAKMGHTDMLTICDAGLPIPEKSERIDLAIIKGIPGFIPTCKALVEELVIEKAIMAEEIKKESEKTHQKIKKILGDIPIEYYSHSDFKKLSTETKAIVRTGETTAYANIILVSGVDF